MTQLIRLLGRWICFYDVEMTELLTISTLVANQKSHFQSGLTLDFEERRATLQKLKKVLQEHEQSLMGALNKDLRKPTLESYVTELGFIYSEISHALKNLKKWMRPRKVSTPLVHSPARSCIYPEPYGVVLIIGPWNYPLQLLISPLIGALAAGNTAILKLPEMAEHTSAVLKKIIDENFAPTLLAAVSGGKEVSQKILEHSFDYIFFTGGTSVGRIVMEAATKHLTPVTLELGGKSPCIVDHDASVALAARRIVWGKFVNAGQTCVAPDYLLVYQGIKNELIHAIKTELLAAFGADPKISPDYGRIINEKNFERLSALLKDGELIIGGQTEAAERYIAPTLIEKLPLASPLLQEEIFGPILPIVEFANLDEAIGFVRERPHPLALYYFSDSSESQQKVIKSLRYGGGCMNDTLIHLANPELPFGGVGTSGMGAYHGKFSFDTFTHYKGIVHRSRFLDSNLRYAPYKNKLALLRWLIK